MNVRLRVRGARMNSHWLLKKDTGFLKYTKFGIFIERRTHCFETTFKNSCALKGNRRNHQKKI